MPLILNGVARQAEFVDDMQRVTMNGPMRLGAPFSMTVWWALKKFDVDGPPDPMMSPVRGFDTSSGARPLSSIACCMAMKFHAAPSPMKRRSRLSTWAAMSIVGRPSTWLRKPCSL